MSTRFLNGSFDKGLMTIRKSRLGVSAAAAVAGMAALTVLFIAGCGGKNNPAAQQTVPQYTLELKSTPNESGTFSWQPGLTVDSGTAITVTVTPKIEGKFTFTGWSGAETGTANPVTIIMDGNKTLTATFEEKFSITTNVSPEGSGTITRSSDSTYYSANALVVLTADPTSDAYKFVGWEGDTTVDVDQLVLRINRDLTYTAIFHQSYQILITTEGSGTVSRDKDGPYYEEGEEVTLTATGAAFLGWFDGSTRKSAQTTYKVTIKSEDVRLIAKFAE